jgi:hypothetical protein
MGLTFECLGCIAALLITTLFVVWPTPYLMVLFTFVAVPLFLIVALFFIGRVLRELRTRDVL